MNPLGKYQLDSKGKASVAKFHEKNVPEKMDKNQRIKELREQHLKKAALKKKPINN